MIETLSRTAFRNPAGRTLSLKHEWCSNLLAEMIAHLADEFGLPRANLGSMTVKRKAIERGFESDKCFYLASYPRIRGKKTLDFAVDPPPDLAVEVDITSSSINRLGIYEAFKVPEIWRFDGDHLEVRLLAEGQYVISATSHIFPLVPLGKIAAILKRENEVCKPEAQAKDHATFACASGLHTCTFDVDQDQGSLMREFRAWVREQMARDWQPEQTL